MPESNRNIYVDESEGPEFEEIKEDLGDVIAAAMQVRCAKLTPAE